MKKRFLAGLFALSLLAPVLTGCFLSPSDPGEGEGGDPEETTPSIHIAEDELLTKSTSGSNYWYNLDLAMSSSYHLNVDLGDYTGTNYSLVYVFDVDDTYKDVCAIDTNNNITTKEGAEIGDRANLKVRLMKKGKSYAVETRNIYITVRDQYANIKAVLTSKSSDVEVGKGGYDYDFKLSIPMSGKTYLMPDIRITNLEDYSLTFAPQIENAIEFNNDDNDFYFMLNADDELKYKTGAKYFDINVFDKDGVFIKKFTCLLSLTYDDPEVFQIFYGEKRIQLVESENILIEKTTDKTPVLGYYDNYELNSVSSVWKIEVEDTSVVSASTGTTSFGYKRYLQTVGVGETNVDFIYNQGGTKERTIHTRVVVYDGKDLKDIYVPLGSDAFTIVGNNVYVTGKIYAVFEVGEPEAINGSDDLSIILDDTGDPNVKSVTVEFTYKGVTKAKVFSVPVTKVNTKTEITQNYQSYWANNSHNSTPTKGNVKVLAIPIWFTDSDSFINDAKGHKQQIIDDITLGLFGSNDDISFRSLRTYYLEESLGSLNISGKVTPWYECGKISTYYGDQDTNITTLVADAIKWYFDESGTTDVRSDYDSNGDGKIDHVVAYYGANYHCFRNNYAVASGWCRRLTSSYAYESSLSNFSWVSAMNMYGLGGLSPNAYKQLEKDDLSSIHGIDVKTTIHEFAHGLGISDVYDTNMTSSPVGSFTMQSSNKGGHDPYNLMGMGFANPYVFDSSDSSLDNEITFTIHDSQSSGDMILLTPHWDNSKQIFDEYMLLDLYTPTGLNAYHAKSTKGADCVGIRLWHINAEIDPSTHKHKYTNNSVNTNYDLVHYIRNDVDETYRSLSVFGDDNIFKQGDSFTMDAYKSQFYNADGKLDSGLDLGWSFEVVSINVDEYGSATAIIKLTKTN